jgi:fructan beta-fructosidase
MLTSRIGLIVCAGLSCLLATLTPGMTAPVSPTGGGTGGTPFYLACAPNEVVAGIYGRAGLWLDRIGLKCVRVNDQAQWMGPPHNSALFTGGDGASDFERICPPNSAVSGLRGKQGQFLESLELSCRPLTSGFMLTGMPTFLPAVGGTPFSGTPFGPLGCPNNDAAAGAYGKSGIYVDSLGFRCMNEFEWRPRFHFSPAGWMNDPSGLVYADGFYHLYYQAVPGLTTFDPAKVVWDHAVSHNLVTWMQANVPNLVRPVFTLRERWAPFTGSAIAVQAAKSSPPPCSCPGGTTKSCVVAFYTRHMLDVGLSYNKEIEVLAPSCDGGFTFAPDALVLDNKDYSTLRPHFRDPKVVWFQDPRDPAKSTWIMALAAGDRVKLFSSKDLLQPWTALPDVLIYPTYETGGPFVETPNLIPVPVEGAGYSKWVLLFGEGFVPPSACRQFLAQNSPLGGLLAACEQASNHPSRGFYLIGDFDGTTFTPDIADTLKRTARISYARPLDLGPDFYAGQVWANVPVGFTPPNIGTMPGRQTFDPNAVRQPLPLQPRQILAGWQSNWTYAHLLPTLFWRGNLTIPRELSIVKDLNDHMLLQRPVAEVASVLRSGTGHVQRRDVPITGTLTVPEFRSRAYDAELAVDVRAASQVNVELRSGQQPDKLIVEWRRTGAGAGSLAVNRNTAFAAGGAPPQGYAGKFPATPASLKLPDEVLRLRILVDRNGVEVFAGDGRVVISALFFPDPRNAEFKITAQGTARVMSLDLYDLDR